MGRPFRWPRWGVATQSSILILIITGCSAAPAETIVPDPSATHFPSESPIASQTTGGTAEVLDCVVADYPCTWAEVPEGVLVRSRELALSAHGQHSSGGSYLTSGEWLREQEGVAEVLADESGVRFRLERGRPVWLLDRPDVGSDVSGLAYVMARRVAPPRGSRPGRVVDSRQERGREARSGFDAVVGNEEPEKHATVLAPFAWHPGMDASSIAELLDGTRGYEGGVSYLANWAPDESTVSFASFADLPGEDVVYIKSYGGQVCPDGEACHATIAVQELDDADFHLDDAEAAILDIIVWPDGSESLSVEADFFRSVMPGGIPHALIFMDVERIIDDTLTRAIKHPTSEYYYWDGFIVAAESLPVIGAYIDDLAASGRSPTVVYHEMADDLRVQGTLLVGVKPFPDGALRIREVVALADPASGELRDGSTIPIDGNPGDGEPDMIHVTVMVDGMTEEESEHTTINLLVDGEPRDPPQNPADGSRFGDYAYGLLWDLEMGDLQEGQEIELEAIAQLTEGGLSRHHATVVATAGSELGTTWEGDVTAVSDTLFPGVTITRKTHVIFVRDPDTKPDAKHIDYFVTGGSTIWEIAGSDGQCEFAAGPFEEQLPVDDGSALTFDVSDRALGVIRYYGSGRLGTGKEITVAKVCEGEPDPYRTSLDGTWWTVPPDEEYLVTGPELSGIWSRGSVVDTEYQWTFSKVD